jgi:vacuolar protein sorting-associated protein 13A/C
LSNFTIISVNSEWQPAFVPTTAGAINKSVNLESLAIYFNTDSESVEGLSVKESVAKFRSLISTTQHPVPDHQFILKPISGVGKITMNQTVDNTTPKFDVQLVFEEIGFMLDDHQYRDVISMVDMYHFFLRHQQYRKLRPSDEEIAANKAHAMFKFAGKAILEQVHDRRKGWTWGHFRERRDDRKRYVELYKKKLPGTLVGPQLGEVDALECKLSYEDLRFYRSIARSELRKDLASRRRIEEEKKKSQAQAGGGWFGWVWGSETQPQQEEILGVQMNDQRRKELYDALDYDERAAVAASFEPAKDSLKVRATAKLNKGSLTLLMDPHGRKKEVIGMVFETLRADVIQRPTNFEACVTLGDLHVRDGITEGTLYHDIVRIKRDPSQPGSPTNDGTMVIATGPVPTDVDHAFLMVKFEQNPMDERADNALTVRLGSMEVIYHKGYVEAVYDFFKPPETHMESINALMVWDWSSSIRRY